MKTFFSYYRYGETFLLTALLAVSFLVPSVEAQNLNSEQLLQMANEVSEQASNMAIKAKETNDYYQAQHAFALASEALSWVFEVSAVAKKMPDPKLAGAAQNAAERIRRAVGLSQSAARKIAASDPDPDVAQAVSFLIDSCEILLVQLNSPPE